MPATEPAVRSREGYPSKRLVSAPRLGFRPIVHHASVTRLVTSAALVLVTLAAVGSTLAARDPRAEKQRLTPRDMTLARSELLVRSDLAPGWRRTPSSPDDDEPTRCPGWNPDFSAFTITGKAKADFEHGQAGASILSTAEVYATRSQAVGDFRTGAKPGLVRCLRVLLDRGFRRGGVDANIVSARMTRGPRIGERSVTYRVVARIRAGGASAPAFFDVHFFQRGRSIAGLLVTGVGVRVPDQLALARTVAARLR
jgi:hypothetical protein